MAAEAESLITEEHGEAPTPATMEPAGGSGKPAASGKPAMVLGIDDSEHSYYALEWTMHHFFAPGQPQQYHLVVVSAKPPASSVIGIAGIGTAELLPRVELDLKRASARVIDKAKEQCSHVCTYYALSDRGDIHCLSIGNTTTKLYAGDGCEL
jgi:hypothetical protein